MPLAVSRHAAPGMRLSQLCDLARARGLDGIELCEADLDDQVELDRAAGFVVGVHVASPAAVSSRRTARLAATLGAPVIAARGAVALAALGELDALYRSEGAKLLLSHGTAAAEAALLVEALASVRTSSMFVAWEVHTKRDDLREARAVLLATRGALRYVRMRGGGPELADEDSAGTGDLVAAVALSGYSGVTTLAPTTADRTDAWGKWLAGKIKNGCGSAYERSKARSGGTPR